MTSRQRAADTTALGVASIVSGVLAYVYTVLGLRAYGPEAFAPIALIWSVWALAVAATTFPIQHWVNWRGTTDAGLARVRAAMPALSGYVVATAVVAGGGLWATVPAFRSGLEWIALIVALVAGSGILGWGRGVLAARNEYRAVALVIGFENGIRVAFAAVVVALGGGVAAFGWALATGPLVLIPFTRRLRMEPGGDPAPFAAALGGLSAAVVVAQAFVQLGPLAAEWLQATEAAISAVFATFALFRAPILVALGAVTQLTTPLTAMAERRDAGQLGRLLRAMTVAVVVAGPLAYLVGASIGPTVVEALFGEGTAISARLTGVTAVGMWLAVIGLVLLVLHVATASTPQAFAIWGGAGVLAVVVALAGAEPVASVAVAFLVGEVVAVVGSLAAHWHRRAGWQPA